MKERFWLFKRGTTFYWQNSETGEQRSLGTKDKKAALRLLELKRQTTSDSRFGKLMLKVCLGTGDPLLGKRTWQTAMDQVLAKGKPSTRERVNRAFSNTVFDSIRKKGLLETTAEDLLSILNASGPSVNHYLRILHNLCVGYGWIPLPILPPKLWPKKKLLREKRAITHAEHALIIETEQNLERRHYYELLWEIGAAQSDAAELTAESIDPASKTLSFRRKKTGGQCVIGIGKRLGTLIAKLPKEGPFFPTLFQQTANDRAAEFYRRCKILKIKGVSLHSYRYSLAERCRRSSVPERTAMELLGHASRFVHQAYAKGAQVRICLDELEEEQF